jgi:PAS domain S-box-containing protein
VSNSPKIPEPALLAAIIRSSDDAIVSKDLNGNITSWNPAAERMFGYTAAEAVGQNITMVIPDDRRSEETVVLSRIRSGQSVEHFQTVRRRKDGTLIYVSLTVSPVLATDGTIVGASKIARDISEQKRLAEELERANRIKDDFLATLSHELRTPIHSILGYTQILRQDSLDEDRRHSALQIIERNTRTLGQLVSDLLDVSRIVSGKMQLETQRCDLGTIIGAAVDAVQPTYDTKGVKLDRLVGRGHVIVLGDPSRLQQIVWNLLANAAKFTPAGGRVQVMLGHGRNQAEIIVTDSGIGIEPAFLPYLFERFQQADSRSSRQYGGLGIGLALVRHLAELHGGTVDAASEGPGRGSTFRVRLPLVTVEAGASTLLPREPTQRARKGRLRNVTVLAVDDDPDSLQLLDEILSTAGASVMCASSTGAGLRLIDLQPPDVIVSDLGMPGRDGFEFIRAVRERSETRGGLVPAAALTAYVRAEDQRHALEAGFQVHLSKPVDPDELIDAVEKLAAERRDAPAAPAR